MILYMKPTCPYCHRVMAFVDENNLNEKIQYRDIVADDNNAQELIARGGKRQVPYLIDEENDTAMYESMDIINYLQKNYIND